MSTETGSSTTTETIQVKGVGLADKVRETLHEGNVRRVVVKNHEGRTILEIPVTGAVLAALVAPAVTAVAALAAYASDWEIDVVRAAGDEPR